MAELSTSFEGAWEQFRALDALRLAEDAGEWYPHHGRAQMLVFIIRMEDPAVRTYAASIVERLDAIPGVEPYPEDYWHITVKAAGYQVIKATRDDDVLREEVGRLGKDAALVLSQQPVYDATIALPNAFSEVVYLEVRDDGNTCGLNKALTEGIDKLLGYPVDGDAFLPHMSIARFTSQEGLAELKAALTELRNEAPGPAFQVRRVDFVKAWLSDETPEFETLASIPLAAS